MLYLLHSDNSEYTLSIREEHCTEIELDICLTKHVLGTSHINQFEVSYQYSLPYMDGAVL